MEFDVKNKGSDINICVTFRCGYAGDYIYNFSHNASHESHAGLLAKTIYDQFYDHIKAIRKSAYEAGWNDKKKRIKKRTDFDWCPNQINMD